MTPSGGKRPGAGRPKGRLNAVSREIRGLAQEYTEEALRTLVEIMRKKSAPEAARGHAATTILAYGHGKPRQAVEHSGSISLPPIVIE